MKKLNKNMFWVVGLIILIAATYRLTDHPHNFAPITAICLLAGAYISRNGWTILIAFLALYFSDFLINNFGSNTGFDTSEGFIWFHPYMFPNLLAFGAIVLLAALFLKKKNIPKVILASLVASLIFFLVTNAGAWLQLPNYTKDLSGLMASYTAGVPFFRATILGDLVFTCVLFGAAYLVESKAFNSQSEPISASLID